MSTEKKFRDTTMTKEEFKAFCERLYNHDYYLGKTSNYKSYFNTPEQIGRTRTQVEEFLEAINLQVSSKDPILCLGCGIGWEVKAFNSFNFELVQGLDGCSWAVENRIAPVILHNLVDPLPFPDKTFQLVTAIDVLEHIPTNLLPEVAREIGRVIQPLGFIYIVSVFEVHSSDVDPGHLTLQAKSWWIDLFKEDFSPYLTLSTPISFVLRKDKKP